MVLFYNKELHERGFISCQEGNDKLKSILVFLYISTYLCAEITQHNLDKFSTGPKYFVWCGPFDVP